MGSNRFSMEDGQVTTSPPVCSAGFTAVPAMLLGVMDAYSFQHQLYQWAFEQARQTVQAQKTGVRELFAIMN